MAIKVTSFPELIEIPVVGDPTFKPTGVTGFAKEFRGDIYTSRGRFGNGTDFVDISATAIKSNNFDSGTAGWKILYNGDVEFNEGVFRGSITVGSIFIGTSPDWFRCDTSGNIWSGADTLSNAKSNKFAVENTGALYCTSATISGAVITTPTITNIQSGSEIAIQGWTHDLVFSVTDADTIAWASGTITLMNGDTYSIDAGNTGNMAAETFVYLDVGTSITVLQTTTTKATAVGSGKIMIAICENATGEAIFRVFGSTEQNIDAGVLRAASITVTEIANNAIEEAKVATDAITATKINVSGLDGTSGNVAADHIVAGMLQTDCVTSAKIQADAVTATKINVVGLNGATGRIVVTDATDANVVTGGINTHATTLITAGKIVISGATNLDDWRKTGDLTMIDGGSISTGTVTATQILANTITASEIAANTITASEIFAGTITATEITGTTLSAIYADLGTITAGNITIDSSGYIKGGQTAYHTGSGFWLGYDTTAYKFSIGDGTDANSMTWDGTDLTVKGQTFSFANIFGDGSDGTITISADTTLIEDMHYNNLTIDSTKTLKTAGFKIFVKNTFINNGTVSNNGLLAVGGVAGTCGGGGQGGGTTQSQVPANYAPSLGGHGGSGGGYNSGGTPNTATPTVTATKAYPRSFTSAVILYDNEDNNKIVGGGGGAAGRDGGGSHGDGGGGGGIILIAAKTFTNNGVITANGANGVDGGGTNSGGGGGGGGGAVLIAYNSGTVGTLQANGGTGGSGTQGGGLNGGSGTAGIAISLQI